MLCSPFSRSAWPCVDARSRARRNATQKISLPRPHALHPQRLGDAHLSVADVRAALAGVHALAGRRADALSAIVPAVTIYSAALGAEHPSTVAARALADAQRGE